ncbi:helix-turn-helix transcriptional regulator [Lentilitoribacter sp. Alg239-R112]|uniref:helix-turn-helix domain-containing protein n=1 Tax=Lentilitoribacter sp. Alg239-R112 TaxID=2305987 RepID=UPI0013A70219|nr:helix-turn-helix transcriptional regulator [Lentilitoribacter sp. Alg239-R112]
MTNNNHNSIEVRLGKRIKCRREELDIDISDLSKRSEIPISQIASFERGVGTLEVAEIQRLSSALSMPIALLFEDETRQQKTYNFISPKDGLALNYAFLRIENELVRNEVIALIQALSSGDKRLPHQEQNDICFKLKSFRKSLSD